MKKRCLPFLGGLHMGLGWGGVSVVCVWGEGWVWCMCVCMCVCAWEQHSKYMCNRRPHKKTTIHFPCNTFSSSSTHTCTKKTHNWWKIWENNMSTFRIVNLTYQEEMQMFPRLIFTIGKYKLHYFFTLPRDLESAQDQWNQYKAVKLHCSYYNEPAWLDSSLQLTFS